MKRINKNIIFVLSCTMVGLGYGLVYTSIHDLNIPRYTLSK